MHKLERSDRERRRARLSRAILALALWALALALPAGASAAAPKTLWTSCPGGSGAGQCIVPSGIAADPATGNLYVADVQNNRIVELTAWGQFLRAWGWGVRNGAREFQTCTRESGCQKGIEGPAAGEFAGPLGPGGIAIGTGGNVYVADQSNHRIEEFNPEGGFLRAWGGGVLTGGAAGTGDLSEGSTQVLNVTTTSKTFEVGQSLSGSGIAANTTIADIGAGTLTLSKPALASGSGVALTVAEAAANVPTNEKDLLSIGGSPSGGSFTLTLLVARLRGSKETGSNQITATSGLIGSLHVGDSIEGGLPAGTKITAIDTATGSLAVSAPPVESSFGDYSVTETTAPIPYDASAETLAEALEALPYVGSGNVAVTGPAGGPWTIEYQGPLLGDTTGVHAGESQQLSVNPGGLTPSGTASAEVLVRGASAPEVCTVASECRGGVEGTAGHLEPGQFGAWAEWTGGSFISAGPGGAIYVGDAKRVQEFEPNGSFIKSVPIPGEKVQSLAVVGPGNPAEEGDLYVAFFNRGVLGEESKEGVVKLGPAGELKCTAEVKNPRALALDAAGNLYVVDGVTTGGVELQIRKFTPDCKEVKDATFPFSDGFDESIGIAANTVTESGAVGLYVSDFGRELKDSFVRAYYPPPDLWPPPAIAPTVDAQYATQVTSHEAALGAKIDPHFWTDTRYYVQYGTGRCSEGGCPAEQPLPPGSLLTSEIASGELDASAFLSGLAPDTTYHFRFIAESSGGGPVYGTGSAPGSGETPEASLSEGGEGTFITLGSTLPPKADCSNQSYRIGFAAKLPDCRAYEMVSPVDKNGGDAGTAAGFPEWGQQLGSTDGNRFVFDSTTAFAEAQAAPLIDQYLSQRMGEGWQTRSISPPRSGVPFHPAGGVGQFMAFSPDLCHAWFEQENPLQLVAGAATNAPNLYGRDECSQGPYELLTSVEAEGFDFAKEDPESEYFPIVLGFSSDGSHAVFSANAKLTKDACSDWVAQTYETSPEGGLRLISVLPPQGSSQPPSCRNTSPGYDHTSLGNDFRNPSVYHAVSEDGSRVFFLATQDHRLANAPHESSGSGPEGLFLRVNALQPSSHVAAGHCTEAAKACTVALSKSGNSFFWGANPEGDRALFSEVEGDKPVGDNNLQQLREFDLSSGESTPIASKVIGVAGFSTDLSRVYFASREDLTGAQQNSAGQQAQDGQPNLYFYERGGGFTFVGALAQRDVIMETEAVNGVGPPSPVALTPDLRSARVSSDGLHLAFTSTARASGYDNTDARLGKPDAEIYLYDASPGETGQLRCLSCNPSGARPVGRRLAFRSNNTELYAAAEIPGWPNATHPSQLFSSNGARLFFQSYDALVPTDTNGRRDVYEWERAADPAQCEETSAELYVESTGGCLSLISSGQSAVDSELIDASQGGRDVFFITGSSLLPRDPSSLDVYDAREEGGFAEPAPPAPFCEGETCQSPPEAPNDPTPASAAFEGAGNVVEASKRPRHRKRHAKRRKHHRLHTSHRKARR